MAKVTMPAVGEDFSTDLVAGEHVQTAKLVFGDSTTATRVTEATPLPTSVAALPLPSGASTEATLAALKTSIDALSAKVTAVNTGSVTLDAATLAALESVTAAVTGTVSVSNFPSASGLTNSELRATPVPVSGTVSLDAGSLSALENITVTVGDFPTTQAVSGSVSVSNFPATQAISGTVNTGLSQPLTDTQLRATAIPVSGTVTVSNPTPVGLTDAELRATALPVSGTVTVSNPTAVGLTDAQLRATSVPVAVASSDESPVVTGGVADWLMRRLSRAVGRLSFDATNQLRVAPANISTVSTVTTVTTVTTGNMGIGDAGKPATVLMYSRQFSAVSTRRNLIRT